MAAAVTFARLSPSLFLLDNGREVDAVVYCFAHAGSGISWVMELASDLPQRWRCCAVCLPGRETRVRDEPAASVRSAVSVIAAEITDAHPSVMQAVSMDRASAA